MSTYYTQAGMMVVCPLVQIIWRCCDDPEQDVWLDISPLFMTKGKADTFHRVLAIYDRLGEKLSTHRLVWPKEYGIDDGLTMEELKELQEFDLDDYHSCAPPKDAACVIIGRYVIHEDY